MLIAAVTVGLLLGLFFGWSIFGCTCPEQPEIDALSARIRKVTTALKGATNSLKEN